MLMNVSPLTHVIILAALAAATQVMDFLTAMRMLLRHGPSFEMNPLVRAAYVWLGPFGVAWLKLVPLLTIVLLVLVGQQGRPRAARNSLVLAVLVGSIAALSNLV
jgi:Domain of unknown function (DUF5658)